MPKIPTALKDCPHHELMIYLDDKYQELSDKHYKAAPTNGSVPVGGGDWMDTFFRMEAIRGCLSALRLFKPLDVAIAEGKTVSEISIQIWNTRRKGDYQTHRWEQTAHDYLDSLIRLFNVKGKTVAKDTNKVPSQHSTKVPTV